MGLCLPPSLSEETLHGCKYFRLLGPLFAHLHRAGNRQLFYDQYASLLLLYFFNPVVTSLRGLQQTTTLATVQARLFGRGVSEMAVDKAIGVVALVAVLVVGGTLLLSTVELRHAAHVHTPGRSEGLLFEVVSALSTVGLTTGITPTLAPGGKLIVIVLMFVGRLGPLTVAMAIARKKPGPTVRPAEEPLMIG